ncbi:isoprenylcysteine carboxylmethyltransferase family protein [Streptomyces sp. NPDC050625]|uniref:methyltransferase family protein n=1 Tax=Streptomyces sp. NPDC050625 TaxID=3154629 RepID=UPI00342C70E7
MNPAVLLLLLLDFALITALPRVFFLRSGTLNVRWWLTALPVGLCPTLVVACQLLDLRPVTSSAWLPVTGLVAIVLFTGSIALIALTLGTHRAPIALWHQNNDDPRHIVTWGAYRHIRHPFYTSFLLAFTGALLAFPHWITLALLIYMAMMLNVVAAKEEHKLRASEFGEQYHDYMTRTGRFLPRWTRPVGRKART